MKSQRSTVIENAVQIGLIALLAFWCFKIAAPFINPLIWAGIIAIGIYPVFLWLKDKTGLSSVWASALLTLAMLVILITPSIILSNALIDNTQALASHLEREELVIPPPDDDVGNWPIIGEKIRAIWLDASRDPTGTLRQFDEQIKKISQWFISLAASAGLNILIFIISIIIAGVFLVSAQGAKNSVVAILTRLVGQQGSDLTELSLATVKSVVTGILGVAVIQMILAGLGFVVMDIPAAGVLAFVCLILAVVQIDIILVLIPLSIYAFSDPATGTGAAIAFLVWNIGVGLLNNVLKPILLAKGVNAPMGIIFVGAIGGMILMGIVGLFVGAVVMVLGYTLFTAWLSQDGEGAETARTQEI